VDVRRLTETLRSAVPADTDSARIRDAAWIARCVGRGAAAPLSPGDVAALADRLTPVELEPGQPLFGATGPPDPGVWIVREGHLELSVRSGNGRVVVGVLRPGDVEGDIPLLMGMAPPYVARAVDRATCLHLSRTGFEALIDRHPAISRRWLTSVAQRLAISHGRLIGLLGRSLPAQLAGLLLDEAEGNDVRLPQRTLAAMLGVARPSLNKVLKDFERRGYVAVRYSTVEVRDPTALARIRAS
jgi:CRP-like cAMP-binding protein